jgi:ribose transport system substrate-binding protein
VDIPYAKWKTDAVDAGKSATLAKTTTTFLPLFDGLGALLAEGVRQARLANATVTQPRMHSFGGSPFFIQLGQDNNRVEGVVVQNMNWLGWATMDQVLRVLTRNTPLISENTGLRSLDDDSWAAEGQGLFGIGFPPKLDQGWGDPRSDDGWITGYRKLWGLPANSTGPAASNGGGGDDDD